MIIGVTGLVGSGKGAVSDILVGKGFFKLGHSGIIDEELRRRGISTIRDNQVAVANEMRLKMGPEYWAKKLIERIEPGKNYVVEGFRNTAEVSEFKKISGFFLAGVAAGKKRRFEWLLKRARPGDPKNMVEFEKNEGRDFLQVGLSNGQQNALCFSMADYFVSNEGTLDDLSRQVELLLSQLDFK